MLKTYRIIPSAFILFLFGLTLITVSPVSAEDSPEFMACKQIKPRGNFKLMKQKKNCFRDVARLFQGQSGPAQPVAPIDPSGGEVAQLNNRIAELEGQLTAAAASQGPLNARVAELEGQLSAATAAQGPLNARVAELDERLTEATAAQGPLNAKVAELEGQLADAVRSKDHYIKVNATLTQNLSELEGQLTEATAARVEFGGAPDLPDKGPWRCYRENHMKQASHIHYKHDGKCLTPPHMKKNYNSCVCKWTEPYGGRDPKGRHTCTTYTDGVTICNEGLTFK